MGVSTTQMKVIPAFGDWDCYYNSGAEGGEGGGLPITEYFESARAAGLGRGRQQQQYQHHGYNCCHQLPPYLRSYHYQYCDQKRRVMMMPNTDNHQGLWWEQRRQSEEGPLMVRQQLQHRRRSYHCNYDQQPTATAARKQAPSTTGRTTPRLAQGKVAVVRPAGSRAAPKAVDEDLYKIPTELLSLHQRATTRRRSILRAWRCMGIHCVE